MVKSKYIIFIGFILLIGITIGIISCLSNFSGVCYAEKTRITASSSNGNAGPAATLHPDYLFSTPTEKPIYSEPSIVWEKNIPVLEELSGIAASMKNPDILWAHNDSGNKPILYAINIKSGAVIKTFEFKNINLIDWEDLCIGNYLGKETIFIGDIGDNNKSRKTYTIYQIEEPLLTSDAPLNIQTYQFKYPEGSFNCEALAYHVNGSLYLLTKDLHPRFYQLELSKLSKSEVNIAAIVGNEPLKGKIPSIVTGMDISRDGCKLLIRTYIDIFQFAVKDPKAFDTILSGTPVILPAPSELQGEAICYDPFDQSIYTASEGQPKILYQLMHN